MNNKAYNAIIFTVLTLAFVALVYLNAPWWVYFLYLVFVAEAT